MADNVVHGTRGTSDFSPAQRPTNFGHKIKFKERSRITRDDVKHLIATKKRVKIIATGPAKKKAKTKLVGGDPRRRKP